MSPKAKPTRAKRPKTATKTASSEQKYAVSPLTGAKIPLGAHPGNTGGKPGRSGRPSDDLRASMRGTLTDILPGLLGRYTSGEIDAVRFADFLAKYGLGTKEEITVVSEDVQARLARQVQLIASKPTWDTETLLDQLSEVWT